MQAEGNLRIYHDPSEPASRNEPLDAVLGEDVLGEDVLGEDEYAESEQGAGDRPAPVEDPAKWQSLELVGENTPHLVFQSDTMRRVIEQARRFARSSATVLLTGESGTGKELIAHLIHQVSSRAEQRYVRVNCAALSESLMESELFGHERGAFTGALDSHVGRFEWADGGTLLLDEISEIPVRLQAKLLRVLEEEEFQRVGSNATRQANVRIIATTNRDLTHEVREGNFRADLFHRLNVLQIELPALRQRVEDIQPLASYFLSRFRQEAAADLRGFDASAQRAMRGYDWPGNVRQLRNVVHRACVLCSTEWVGRGDLPALDQAATVPDPTKLLEMSLEEIERWVILRNLRRFNGNKTAAATHLGVTARTLSNKMKTYREQGLA